MISVIEIPGMLQIERGDDLGSLIAESLHGAGMNLKGGDIIVVAQTVVSRSEGSVVRLQDVTPSKRAIKYAKITGKDPRLVEVVLGESRRMIHASRGFMVCETKHGFVCANAGVDASNNEMGWVSTLPKDPDSSARGIAKSIKARCGLDIPVIISDSEGRPFRRGAIGVAVGVHGMAPVRSLAGNPDYFGRKLETTEVAVADRICSAAALVMGEGAEGLPVIIVRGVIFGGKGGMEDLLYERDVFKEGSYGRGSV